MLRHTHDESAPDEKDESRLFAGPGEMRALCRSFDWSTTALGPVERWPQSLRTAVQIVLAARIPMLLVWWPDLNAIYNEGLSDILGSGHPAALGQSVLEFAPEYREFHEQIYGRVRAGESVSLDDKFFLIERSPGVFEKVWFSLCYSPVRDESGAVGGALVVGVETTARKHAESRQAFLLQLADQLRTLDNSMSMQQVACCLLGEHLGVNRCSYADIEGDDFMVRPNYVSGVPPLPAGRISISSFGAFLLDACRRGETVVVDDVSVDPRITPAERERYRAMQNAAFAGVMLVKGGRLVGAFALQSATPRHWTQMDLELLRDVADRTWVAMERAQAEVALRVSEEQMRLAMQAATMVHWTMDDATGLVSWSANYADVMGFAVESTPVTVMDRIRNEVHPDDEALVTQAIVSTTRGEGDTHFEYRMRVPGTDELIWIEISATRVVDAKTGGVRIVGVAQNINQRKRAEQALREAEARQAFLLELSDRLRALTDPRAIMNTAAEMLGRRLAVSMLVYRLYEADGNTSVRAASYSDGQLTAPVGNAPFRLSESAPGWAQAMRSGQEIFSEDVKKEPHLVFNDPRRFTMRASAAIPLIKEGRLVAVLVVAHVEPRQWSETDKQLCREVAERTWSAAERARAEAALRVSEEQLRHAMTLRDEFLAVVGHELRTPLSAILIWGKLLRAGAVSAAVQAQAFSVIEQSALAQRKVIDDLLDVSGMVSGKVRMQMEEAEIGPLLAAGLEAVRPMADAKHLTFSLDLGTAPVWARIDRARFQQVVWNLANNAVKFTPAGGQVTLRLRQLDAAVQIEVEDTGRGIAPSFLPYVFDRFRQADSGITRVHGGLGLGLAIVHQLVEFHGGTIEARSSGEGKGATFTVLFPRIEIEAAAQGLPASEVSSTASSLPYVPEPVLNGVRVLFAEDEAHTRAAVQWLLEQCGAEVTPAGSAAEALSAFDAVGEGPRFDILVSDVGLPEKSGYELLADMRCRRMGATLPALALTAYARNEDKQRALAAGFTAYLAKPVEPRALVETIAAMVARRSTARQRRGSAG
jgi:PAS domain S-box-containing protein